MGNLLLIVWLFLPTGFANPAPVIAKKIPLLSALGVPLDGRLTFRGKRILGQNKTLRGLIAGVIMGAFCGFLQFILASQFSFFAEITSLVDYQSLFAVFYGACIGAGTIAGDAIKSFFKRQIDIAPGKNWVPFDQIDFAIGVIIVSFSFYSLDFSQYVLTIALALVLHPTYNIISWLAGLQENPF